VEFVDLRLSPGGVSNQNAIPHRAAENDEVIIPEGVDWHHERRALDEALKAS
jgi:hypothetical protein